jgi:hypothetical protein
MNILTDYLSICLFNKNNYSFMNFLIIVFILKCLKFITILILFYFIFFTIITIVLGFTISTFILTIKHF